MRISARLDESRSEKLQFLCDAMRLGASEILKRAIDAYFEQFQTARPAEILRRTGFVGSGEADPELSVRAKDELASILHDKHDHH